MAEAADPSISEDDLQTFLKAWNAIQEAARAGGPGHSTELRDRVEAHLGVDPAPLQSASTQLLMTDAVNHDLALEALDPERELLGLNPDIGNMGRGVSLASLLSGQAFIPNEILPVTWTEHPVDVDEKRTCPVAAVALLTVDRTPVVVAAWPRDQHGPVDMGGLHVEVLAEDPGFAREILQQLEKLRTEHNVYRGKVLGFTFSEYGHFGLEFIALPIVSREQLILPEADLAAIERHSIGISDQADALAARGRHLKRGMLLYGPPGTGKTHTVSYLVASMPGRTTIVLQGPSAGAIGQAAAIARAFPPATIVIEDVDLIAYDRGMGFGDNPMLFQLLNEMDGFADDSDLLFILTTNRAEILEPALAARPGRVDQAIEVAKPDTGARVRLLELYLADTGHEVQSFDAAAERLDGVTASFIKELARRALMNALDADRSLDDGLLDETITELLEHSAPVVHSSLGAGSPHMAPGFGPDGYGHMAMPEHFGDEFPEDEFPEPPDGP